MLWWVAVLCCVLSVSAAPTATTTTTQEPKRLVINLKRVGNTEDAINHMKKVREVVETDQAPENSFVSLLQVAENKDPLFKGTKHASFKYLEYHGVVTVGGNKYNMLFDTATPHTWLPSSVCHTCCAFDEGYAAPELDQAQGASMFEQFADGTWYSGVSQTSTFTFSEDLAVPDLSYFQILVKGSSIVAAPSSIHEKCSDNVMGLGFTSRWGGQEMGIDTSRVGHRDASTRELDSAARTHISVIDRLHQEHLITEPVFSLYLVDDEDGSELELGSINSNHISKRLNPKGLFWVSAVGFPNYHWAFNVPRVCFDDDCQRTGNIPARISSAVPYIAIPQDLYRTLRQTQERVLNPCLVKDSLPILSLVVVGSDQTHVSSRYSGNLELCPNDYVMEGPDGTCDFALVPTKLPMIILGTPFLRKFFTVFDIEQKRMGFAQTTELCKESVVPTKKQLVKAVVALQKQGVDPQGMTPADLDSKMQEAIDEVVRSNATESIRQTHHMRFLN
eukprot:c15130_g1_i1.p1 GENE.c15130_g1_i1~~c15130_g1_i1.p1  ORF type:complete len:504 (+),score=136.03 c15130_g1_i1:42-1553(+)